MKITIFPFEAGSIADPPYDMMFLRLFIGTIRKSSRFLYENGCFSGFRLNLVLGRTQIFQR